MILIANPGTHPEMMRIAGGLIEAGHSIRYYTSSSWADDSRLQQIARRGAFSRSRVARDLRRRTLPSRLNRKHVIGVSRAHEFFVQVCIKTGVGSVSAAIQRRNQSFQRSVVRELQRNSNIEAVVAQYTAARDIFELAPDGVTRILNYPIVHHRWLKNRMQREAGANPIWAPMLQGHDFTDSEFESLDEEVAMADLILVPSSFAASTFHAFGVPSDKLWVIPLGCSAPDAVGRPPVPQKIQPNEFASTSDLEIIFAGQTTQRKGLGYLVETVRERPDIHLTVVGPATPEGRSFLEMNPGVRWIPSVPRSRLYELLGEADLLVLPSLAEGFGLVALEAMANGTPCLLSKHTFAPDLIQHGQNGYILDEVSQAALHSALDEISAERDQLARVGLNAAATAAYYSWERYSQSVALKIEEICGIEKGR